MMIAAADISPIKDVSSPLDLVIKLILEHNIRSYLLQVTKYCLPRTVWSFIQRYDNGHEDNRLVRRPQSVNFHLGLHIAKNHD